MNMKAINEHMIYIRDAQAQDFKAAAPLIVQAMEDLARFFTQSDDLVQAITLFEHFFQQQHNQYSFEHTLICEIENEIVGTLSAYDGALLSDLRAPFLQFIEEKYHLKNFFPADETQAGEYYIDTISVSPKFQGMRIGTKLLEASMEKAKHLKHKKMGLLVDVNNPNAERLYTRLGFQPVGFKEFMGGTYQHMQFKIG